jgi:threonine/homoserine/homoserine lactone efflux protein
MTDSELTALLLLATAASFTPGPNTTLSTALAANRGLRGALHFVFAVPVGWALLLSACAAGLGSLVVAVPLLRWGILAFGMGYLLWLALRLARSTHLTEADASRLDVTFLQGVMLQFLNIKAWMLALAVVAGWIAGRPDAMARALLVLPLMVAFGLASNLLYALMGSLLRHWLAGPVIDGHATGQRLRQFNRSMATVLVLTACWMAYSSAGMPDRPHALHEPEASRNAPTPRPTP